MALFPTVAAYLLIKAGPQAWLNRILLSNRALVRIGLISFPLYLWHWPLLTFAEIQQGKTPSTGIRLLMLCLSILLAWLTYRFIEQPIRFGALKKHSKHVVIGLCSTLIAAAAPGAS